ncbi:MAG: cytochrome P450 [Acidimicrobiales bacterium]
MSEYEIAPVADWATDWDHHHPRWVDDPYPIWEQLRESCPMAHTGRFNEGVWLPLRFDDVTAIAHDTDTFSNGHDGMTAGGTSPRDPMPPISSDPPDHGEIRRAILPFFAPKRMETWAPQIAEHCDELAAAIANRGHGDAAVDYAQHIPVGAISAILGVDPADGDRFRIWIRNFSELGDIDPELRRRTNDEITAYLLSEIADRRAGPRDDLISHLTQVEVAGQRLDDDEIRRISVLQLLAGIDTTWSAIGASLWHLATHPHDRARLVAEPELVPTAVEELLRAYAPVHVVRRVTKEAMVNGVEVAPGDSIMLAFPIACRDPEQFDRPDEVLIDRKQNRHVAFGSGIHRCLGSNLARLEIQTAVAAWLEHIPDFALQPGATVTWSDGQIRGPRSIPITVNA